MSGGDFIRGKRLAKGTGGAVINLVGKVYGLFPRVEIVRKAAENMANGHVVDAVLLQNQLRRLRTGNAPCGGNSAVL